MDELNWDRDDDLLYILKDGVNFYEVKVTQAAGSRKLQDRAEFAAILRGLLPPPPNR